MGKPVDCIGWLDENTKQASALNQHNTGTQHTYSIIQYTSISTSTSTTQHTNYITQYTSTSTSTTLANSIQALLQALAQHHCHSRLHPQCLNVVHMLFPTPCPDIFVSKYLFEIKRCKWMSKYLFASKIAQKVEYLTHSDSYSMYPSAPARLNPETIPSPFNLIFRAKPTTKFWFHIDFSVFASPLMEANRTF